MKRYPRSVWLFALALAFFTSLPYLVGVLNTPEGWRYSGAPAVPIGVAIDYNSHMAKMWQGSRGELDYHLLFTHEAHPGLPLVQGFYVILGTLQAFVPFGLPVIYHVARFLLTIGMVLAIWSFASRFFEKQSERWIALLFGTIVCGWSWLILLVDPAPQVSPIEFWLTDAFNLLGALFMPHFAAAVILQIVIVLKFDDWVRGNSNHPRQTFIILTLVLAADAIVQPYEAVLILPLLVVLIAYHVFSAKRLSWRRALWLLIPMLIHGLLVVYQYVAISSSPIWAAFSQQNQTLSPAVPYYLLGYLPFIIPIALGARRFMIDRADDRWWLPILWVAFVAMLLYGPFPTQRRYLLGVQTPLAMLAAYGWVNVVMPYFRRRKLLVTVLYMTLASIALIGIGFANVAALSNPEKAKLAFYDHDDLQGYAWLQRESSANDLVLTTMDTDGKGSGGRLVAATGHRVFIGHWFETIDFDSKVKQIARFYDPATPESWRQDFLKEVGAVYVWYDDYARAVGAWNPAEADYLEQVFTSDTVTIYRFDP